MKEITCGSCDYWDKMLGHCKRNAPRAAFTDCHAVWPITQETDWCGEGRKRSEFSFGE